MARVCLDCAAGLAALPCQRQSIWRVNLL